MKRNTRILVTAAAVLLAVLAVIPILRGIVSSVDRTGADAAGVMTLRQGPDGRAYVQITAGPANAWLLPCDGGWLLIDTGYPQDYERFRAGLARTGIPVDAIRFLLITHAHDDHAGFAARLKADSGCKLILPRASLEALASGTFVWKGVSVNLAIDLLGRLYDLIKRRDFRFDPVVPDGRDFILAGEASDLPRSLGIEGILLHTPGHSADSWSLILDDGRAFVGDAAMNMLRFFDAGYRPIFMEDREQTYRSMDRIREAGARLILPGHGDPFEADLLPRWTAKAARGPGIAGLPGYLLAMAPGFALIIALLLLGKKADAGFRIALYVLGFILMRDLMTPYGYWSFGSAPVFWLRFAADGPLLFSLAAGSLGLSLLLIFRERGIGEPLTWFKGSPPWAVLTGLGGAAIAAAPVLISRIGILAGERGGSFPTNLIPAVLSFALAGNLLEELLFRGFLQGRFERMGMGPAKAGIASGLAFGLCHVFLAYTVSDVGLTLVAFAAWEGCICGLLRSRFGLSSAILAHGLAIAAIAIF